MPNTVRSAPAPRRADDLSRRRFEPRCPACEGSRPSPTSRRGGRPVRAGDVRHIVASPRARVELGFTATVPFAVGVKAFATAPLRS